MGLQPKCSREDCPTQNIAPNLTVNCYRCNGQIHLLCYEIEKQPVEIFVTKNIVMICDECLETNNASPRRKQSNSGILIQRTIDVQNPTKSLSMTAPISTPPKNATAKLNHQMQAAIESLAHEIKANTATIAGLKTSVDSMKENISEHKVTVSESIKLNAESFSSCLKRKCNKFRSTEVLQKRLGQPEHRNQRRN